VRRLRRTLVDLLQWDISRADDAGPDWPMVVEDAVLRQDMEWVEESLTEVTAIMNDIFNRIGPPPGWTPSVEPADVERR
jgi:hypothetical protein